MTLADIVQQVYAREAERLTPEERATLANAVKLLRRVERESYVIWTFPEVLGR